MRKPEPTQPYVEEEEPLPALLPITVDSTPEEIAQNAAALTVTLQSIDNRLKQMPQRYVSKEEAHRRRRTFLVTVLTSVLAAIVIVTGVNNVAIKECFLTNDSLGPNSVCNTLFPGYNKVEAKGRLQQGQFADLLSQIPRNKQDLTDLQRQILAQQAEISRLQAKIDRLQARK